MMKKLIAMVLTAAMLLSLMVVPAGADLVEGTATLSITPDVTSVKSTGEDVKVTYTIKVTPPEGKSVGEFHFTLSAPEGMTLASKAKVNAAKLRFIDGDDVYGDGIFEYFGYTSASHYFQAAGTTDTRNLTEEATVMTIEATITAGAVGDYTLTATDVGINPDGTNKYTVNVSTTPVSVYSELDGEVAVTGLTAPVKGGAPDGGVSSPDHTSATVAWFLGENAVTGNFAASTQYTAQITVTPDDGYRFADGASFTVDGASDWVVTDGQNDAKVLTKTFPATAAKTLESITVTTPPTTTDYKVGDNFDATGMVVSAHYDEGEDDTNYTNYVVQGGTDLAYGTYPVTIVSNEDSTVTTNTDITVSKWDLPTDRISITPTELTYNGEDQKGNVTVVIKDIATELTGTLNVIYKISDQVVNVIKDVGTYDVYVSTTGDGTMYNPLEQTKVGTVTINKANASVTAPATKTDLTYNGSAQALVTEGTTTGGTMQYKLGADGTYSTDIPTATDAGTYSVYYKVVGNDNYNGVDESSVTVTIAKASIDPTVSIVGWTYGQTANTPSVTGNTGKGTVTYSYAAKGTNDFSDTAPTNAGTYTVKATIAETANYLGNEDTADFTIGKANASVTAPATKTDLTYNGQAKALIDAGSTTGGTMQYKLGADGTYSTAIPTATDAGTYTVYYQVVGNDNYNDVDESSVTVTIKKQPVDVSQLTWQTTDSFNYDAQAKTVTLSSAIPQGLTANYEHNTATYVGEYTATVSFTADDNHEVSGTPATFSWKINPVANPITVTQDSYNLAKGGNTLDLKTLIRDAKGTVTFSVKSGDAATLQGSVLTSGADSSDTPVVIGIHIDAVDENNDGTAEYNAYDNASAISITVVNKEQKELTVTMGGWTYGDNAKSPVFTAPAGSATPVITYTGKDYSSNEAPTDAGTYTVQVVCETATEIYTGSAEFTINPKTASITWSNTSFTYDGQSHVPTATVSNKVGQDSVPVTVSGAATAAGSYTATAAELDNANYVLPATAPTRSFTINQRVAELEWNNTSSTYDGESHVPTATVKNAVGDDTVTVTVTGEKTAAGNYTATAASLSNANYALPTAKTQSFTINKRVAELNWTNTSFTYDGKSHMPTATVTNAVSGDTVTVTVSGSKTNAGTYSATATAISNKNYALGTGTGCDFTIAPKNISDMTVNLSAAALTYNGKAQTKAVASVKDGNTTLSSSRDYTVSGATQTNAGHYELTVTGTGNYTGSKTVAWEIAPKAVTVTANNATKVYGADDPALTAKVSGTVGSDTVVYTVSRAEGNGVGTYAITLDGDENQGNYTVTFKTGTFTITKANASVTSAPQAVTGLKFTGEAKKLITAGQAEGGELQYKLGNGAYGTNIPEATDAGTYTVYYKVVGDANHNNVSEARISVTIAPLSENTAVVSQGNAEVKNDAAEVESALSGMEQYSDNKLDLPENPTEKAAARQEAVKKAMADEAKMTAANPSALYYVNTKNTVSTVSFALPAAAARYNFKVMYMAANGTIEEVPAQVTANGIEVEVPAGADGVYMVAYAAKPVHVVDDSASASGSQSIITDLTDINKVTVDGKTVASKYYTVSGGVVTLSEAYVRTLSNGKHTVCVENAKYISTAVITVSNSTVKSAGTGDMGLGLYAMLALSSVTGAAWLGLKKRKED